MIVPRLLTLAIGLALVVGITSPLAIGEDYEPTDPFAAIDGRPILLGELNLVLARSLKNRNASDFPPEYLQATAYVVVRQHLAMKTLLEKGGRSLQAKIDRATESYRDELNRRGTSLAEQAKQTNSTESSIIADLSWNIAWTTFLKSRMTDKNLRRYFDKHRDRYGGKRSQVSQLVVRIDRNDKVGALQTIQQMTELANQIRAAEDPQTDFERALAEYATPQSTDEPIWVSKPGDLPSPVMRAIADQSDIGILDPVISPIGIHLVFIHEKETLQVSFDDLTDQTVLRRDAASALLDSLVNAQTGADVRWFIDRLKPPTDRPAIPNSAQADAK